MKLFTSIFVIFLAVLPANAQKEINWITDFSQARAVAAESARPMLLDFTAKWCKPCREMEADFWTRADVIDAAKNFVAVKIDLDANGKLADKYGVAFLPNMVMTDAWGNALVFHRGFGRRSDAEIVEKLASIPKDFVEIKAAADTVAAGKNDRDALSKLADFYQQKNFYYLSSEFYKKLLKQEKRADEREKTMLLLGFNYLKVGWTDDALFLFGQFHKEFPKSARADEVLYGRLSALAQKNLLADAETILTELKSTFPQSTFITQAERNLQAYQLQSK